MIVPSKGTDLSGLKEQLKGSKLVIPTHSAGLSACIAVDLFILNQPETVKIGYYKSKYIASGVSNDGLTPEGAELGGLILPCELFFNPKHKMLFFVLRSSVFDGKMRLFTDELVKFIKEHSLQQVLILSSTLNPIRKERETNRS